MRIIIKKNESKQTSAWTGGGNTEVESACSPVFGEGARMALTPNLRKVGSLLLATDVFGEHDSRVIARSGTPLKDTVAVAVCGEALDEAAVRLTKAAGWLIRSRSSTRKLECVGKTDGGSEAAGRYSPGYRAGGARTLGIIMVPDWRKKKKQQQNKSVKCEILLVVAGRESV